MAAFFLDHVIVGVHGLDAAVADWRALGLVPTDGGFHPHTGTSNAIVRFPDRTFLELMAVGDRAKVKEVAPTILAFLDLHPDGAMHWALRTDDIDDAHERVRLAGLRVTPIWKGEGRRSSGAVATWRNFHVLEEAFPFVVQYDGPPTSGPSPDALPLRGLAAAIVQGVSAAPLAGRLARAFGTLRPDGRVQLASGEIVVVEEPREHPGIIGAEAVVADERAAAEMLRTRGVGVVDGWASDPRLHGLALRIVAE